MASGLDFSGMSGSPTGGASSSDQTSEFSQGFNTSGWTVATGGSKANGAGNPWVIGGLVVAGLLAVWLVTKKR